MIFIYILLGIILFFVMVSKISSKLESKLKKQIDNHNKVSNKASYKMPEKYIKEQQQNSLIKDLKYKRLQLKSKHKGKRVPTVCTDEALKQIAKLKPRKKEEFLSIKGLGKTFVEKYGDEFVEVIDKHRVEEVEVVEMTPKTKETLEKLEKKLINISRRNRLLYTGKVQSKYSFDLFDQNNLNINESLIKLVKGKQKKVKLCNLKDEVNYDYNLENYKKLNRLLRSVTSEYRENGNYNLYLAYPFVMGQARKEDFNVRAPLALFPVTANKKADFIEIKIDEEKDVLYNTPLILMNAKVNELKLDIPDPEVKEFEGELKKHLLNFYEKNGITIYNNKHDFKKFNNYLSAEFPEYKKGEYELKENMLLGKFSPQDTAIHRDFSKITESETITKLLNELVENMEEYEEVEDAIGNNLDEFVPYKEEALTNIIPSNFSQEKAIIKVHNEKSLVIKGPPGTGKSQAIVNMISSFVNSGKNVLVVSQKKAALDVVQSRLGHLSKYTVLINSTNNKPLFYSQLNNLIQNAQSTNYSDLKFNQLSEIVNKNIEVYEDIANRLFYTTINNTPAYKIYNENFNNILKAEESINEEFYIFITDLLLKTDYNKLKDINKNFAEGDLLQNAVTYIKLSQGNDYLEGIKDNLTIVEEKRLVNKLNKFKQTQDEFEKLGLFAKMFKGIKRKQKLKEIVKPYFNQFNLSSIYKNYTRFIESVKNINEYNFNKAFYVKLNKEEKEYVNVIFKLNKVLNEEVKELNTKLFNFIVRTILKEFESNNIQTIQSTRIFEDILREIYKSQDQKELVSRDKLEFNMLGAYKAYLKNAKRIGEMKRVAESQRKWSISKFVKKFSLELHRGIKVWLLTPEVVSEILPLEKGLFDLVVFDEASQIYTEKALPAIARGKKVVITGDNKQLRPSSLGFGRIEYDEETDEEVNAVLEEKSLLDVARSKYNETLLNYHYRAKYEELIAFSNHAFYNGNLYVSPNCKPAQTPPITVHKVENGLWDKRQNKQEAIKVVELVKQFLFTREKSRTIGVITFNISQKDLIEDLLEEECQKDKDFAKLYNKELVRKDNGEDKGIFVKNIENVQGDERDHIIFSFAYAKNNEGKVIKNFGWLNQEGGENRLNVAISRAKRKIDIVTSIDAEELNVEDTKNWGPKLFRKYLEYVTAISDNDSLTAKTILYSLSGKEDENNTEVKFNNQLQKEIYEELIKKDYEVELNVGIGGYKIDIAVKDKINGSYMLGIECDSKLYENNKIARERDVHAQLYLEVRGWKIHRVYSNNWYENKEMELSQILNKIK